MASGHLAHYVAAKHGVVGLMRALAIELAPHLIRVNTVHPTAVGHRLVHNEPTVRPSGPTAGLEVTRDDVGEAFLTLNAAADPMGRAGRHQQRRPVPGSATTARYVTGVQLPVDAGSLSEVMAGRRRGRSPSSPAPPAARAAATRSGWPQEGADIIAVDICAPIETVAYPMATPEDLAETVRRSRPSDRRIVASAGRRPRRARRCRPPSTRRGRARPDRHRGRQRRHRRRRVGARAGRARPGTT